MVNTAFRISDLLAMDVRDARDHFETKTRKRRAVPLNTSIEAVYGRFQYVIELKMADDVQGADDAVRAGMLQIRERRYGRSYRNPFLVSLAVGRKERNVVACLFKRGESGSETTVETNLPGKP